jgi:hypothetical protein
LNIEALITGYGAGIGRAIHSPGGIQIGQLQIIAAVEGQVLDTSILDHRAHGGGLGIERGGQRPHLNALLHVTYRQREILAVDLTDADLNVRAGLDANPVRLTRTE